MVEKREKAALYISHFFQAFFNGIARGIFAAAELAFFKLDISSRSVPYIKSDSKLIEWGDNLIDGNLLRVTAGCAAMANPTAAEVTTVFNSYKTAGIAHSNLKEGYEDAIKTVDELRAQVDVIILQAWNEVETYYSKYDIETRRQYGREWGITYESTALDSSLTGTVTDLNNAPAQGVEVTLEQLNIKTVSNSNGVYKFGIITAGTYTLTAKKSGYQLKTLQSIAINSGITSTIDIQMLSVMGSLSLLVISQGQAVASATIEIESLGRTAYTNNEGQGAINDLSPGLFIVKVNKTGYALQIFNNIVINAGGVTSLTADLMPNTGTFMATVWSQGQLVQGSTISISELGLSGITNQSGECTIAAVEAGTWQIQAAAAGKYTQTISVQITANSTVSMSFDLQST